MRSDRNPYFILKNSKNPEVQHWLQKANFLSLAEISNLQLKPDLKKAMVFLKTFGDQAKSASTAELLASKMCPQAVIVDAVRKEIWQYKGPSCWVRCGRTSIEVNPDEYYIKDQEKIFLKHSWIPTSESSAQLVTSQSTFCCMGDFSQLNSMINSAINLKYNRSLR